jgi:Arc/MetJ family transcription regulator
MLRQRWRLIDRASYVQTAYMAQLNIHLDEALEANIRRFMRLSGIRTKSDAVRVALEEGVQRARRGAGRTEYREWLGLGTRAAPSNRVRFRSEDDLWRES